MIINKTISLLIISLLIVACSTTHSNKDKRFKIYDNYINDNKLESLKAISRFRMRGWTPLDNRHLIMSSTHRKSYLLTLKNYCQDLTTTTGIVPHQALSNTLDTKFDSIIVLTQRHLKCRIDTIHIIDKTQHNELTALRKASL